MYPQVPQPQPIATDDEIDLRGIWNLLVRNRWIIAGCIVGVVALASVYTLLTTPVYEAATSIRIDEEKSGTAVLDILQTLSRGSEVHTEMEVLRSRTLAESVVEQLGLQLVMHSPARASRAEVFRAVRVSRDARPAEYRVRRGEDGRFRVENRTTDGILGEFAPGDVILLEGGSVVLAPGAADYREIRFSVIPFSEAVEGLRKALTVTRPNRDANVVVVRYQATDTVLVHEVPNVLARTFISRRQEVQKTEARSAVQFLLEQIDTITSQLAAAENALRAFREQEQVVSLESEASAQVSRLADLQAQRNELDAERAALAKLLRDVRASADNDPAGPSPFRRLVAFPSLLRNQAASELLRSITTVENERAELLKRHTFAHPDVQVLTERVKELEEQLRSITVTYLEGLTNHVASLDATLARFGQQLERIPAKEVEYARLHRQTKVLEEIYLLLQTRLKEAEIAQAVEDPSVRVVDPAIRPSLPIKPRKSLNLALALMLGVMLGTGTAFLREYMDTTVHTREEIQAITGVPVLGVIPRIRRASDAANGKDRSGTLTSQGPEGLSERLVAGRDPRNPVSEAYRSLRTNITFAQLDRPPKALVFTSPTPGDGKSTSAANLAVTLAQQGLKVLLVDADLRRGILHTVFDAPREPGLSNLLLNGGDFSATVHRIDLGASVTLDFLPTGTLPPNPAELLGSQRMHALVQRLEDCYDAILLDAPPLNLVTDAAVLGTNADGVLVIARAGQTDKAALAYAMEQLRTVRAPVLGVVLNDVDFRRDRRYGAYGGYYAYYYGEMEK